MHLLVIVCLVIPSTGILMCVVLHESESSGSASFCVVVRKGFIAKLCIQWTKTLLACCVVAYVILKVFLRCLEFAKLIPLITSKYSAQMNNVALTRDMQQWNGYRSILKDSNLVRCR